MPHRANDLVAADGPLLDQILDATYNLWNEGLSRAAYTRYYLAQLATPWGRMRLRRFALAENGEVLASAKSYAFDATLETRAVRVAGIGAVFTPPAHRGRGRARDLVARLVEQAADDGADLALLFSEIGGDYYARLDFRPIATSDLQLAVAGSARRGGPATLVRAGEDRDLPDLVAMGQARAAPYRFHLDRDRDLIHYALAKKRLLAGLGVPSAREIQFFVAEEGGSAAAYVVITARGSEWSLEELGDRDPAGARAGAILQVLLARDPSERRPTITAWLPTGFCPPQITIVGERPSPEVMMIRPLTAKGTPATALSAADVLYWRADLF
jgi:GNAT superfamily N-acetyltransferase